MSKYVLPHMMEQRSGGIEVIGETQDQIAAIAFLNRENGTSPYSI